MYSESKRGFWFSNRSMKMIYCEVSGSFEFYLINEQEQELIRIRDKKQIELMRIMYGVQIREDEKEWLVNDSGLKYFDSVDDYRIDI